MPTADEFRPTFHVCDVCKGQGYTWKRGQLKVSSNATLCPKCEGGGEVVIVGWFPSTVEG